MKVLFLFLFLNANGKRARGPNFCETLEKFQQLDHVCTCNLVLPTRRNDTDQIKTNSTTSIANTKQHCNNDYDSYGDCVEAKLDLGNFYC